MVSIDMKFVIRIDYEVSNILFKLEAIQGRQSVLMYELNLAPAVS